MSEPMHGMQGRRTLVEEGTSFKGSLSSTCPVEVKGRVEGDVTAPALSVSASGSVHGKVKVGEMQSHGELAGEFDADVVQLSGSVKDRTIIRAKSLEVKLSPAEGKMQVVFGECQLEVGSEAARSELAARSAEAVVRSNEKAPKGSSVVPPEQVAKASSTAPEPAKASSVRPPTDANGA
jgi:cytoskeletal protein CcmA (bactofilin family)